MNTGERLALDRMVGRDGLPAILQALAQSYALHLTHCNGRTDEDVARLKLEKNLVSQMQAAIPLVRSIANMIPIEFEEDESWSDDQAEDAIVTINLLIEQARKLMVQQ